MRGMYGMILCRVVCGQMKRVTAGGHRMMPTIEGALASGEYDAILGDRPRWADSVVILFAVWEVSRQQGNIAGFVADFLGRCRL